jgi:NAD(P)-dependent dehydrogenase (short-subunit alcohol dehydrogenase family)
LDVSLDGKVALVTGAGPNIGSGIALALACYGAKVACNDLDLEASKAAVRRISRNGGEGLALSGDVSVEADVLANIAAALDAWGRIDIVVNNAAWLHTNHILEEDLASFNRAITIAVNGNFLFTKHAALAMIERDIRGSIVSILSSNAWQGASGFIAYATHKGGLANFVRAAAMDLAPYGIGSTASPRPRRGRTTRNCWPSGAPRGAPNCGRRAVTPGSGRPGGGRPGDTTCAATSRWASPPPPPTSGTASPGCRPTTPG